MEKPENPQSSPSPAPAYDSWADYYDIGEGDREPYLHFYRRLLTPATRSILEIACGTGVIASELARLLQQHPQAGSVRVVGIDHSAAMLRLAQARDASVEWLLGDMRSLPVTGTFGLVFCCFNTFQFMLTDEDLLQAFRAARLHVADDGVFAFDLYQPNIPYLSQARRDHLARSVEHDGRKLQIREDSRYEPEGRILDLDWRLVDSANPAEVLARTSFRIRQYFADDIERLLAAAGFRIRERYGDLDRSTFDSGSRKQVLVCIPG